jgi:hypothetical protein
MTLDEQQRLLQSAVQRLRVGQVARRVALVVQAESAATANHSVRASLATAVLQDKTGEWDYAFTRTIATINNLPATPTDAQLVTAVTNVWSAVAGAPSATP